MIRCHILTWRQAILNLVFVKTSNLGEFVTLSQWLSDATEIPNVKIKVAQWNKNHCILDRYFTILYTEQKWYNNFKHILKHCHLKFQTILIGKRLVPGYGYWPELSRWDRRMQPIRWSIQTHDSLTCNNPCQFHFLPYLLTMKNIISYKNQLLNGVLLPMKTILSGSEIIKMSGDKRDFYWRVRKVNGRRDKFVPSQVRSEAGSDQHWATGTYLTQPPHSVCHEFCLLPRGLKIFINNQWESFKSYTNFLHSILSILLDS